MILVFLDETMTLEDTIARYEATKRAAKEKANAALHQAKEVMARVQREVKNAPAPVMMDRYLTEGGFVDREAYPIFVERISVGAVIFSKSYASDAWLYLKNNHLLLSLFMAHPKHPFSRSERMVCLFCSVIMGYGLTCAFNLISGEPDRTVVSVVVGGIIQGLYDALLRMFAECLCVQSCPRCIVKCFEMCGRIGMVVQFLLGCLVLCIGFVAFVTSMSFTALGGVSWRFALSKASSWIVASMIFSLMAHHYARSSQMRPSAARRTFQEKEAHLRWETPSEPCCCGCLFPARAPSYFWNYYIGEDCTYDDLPPRAPKYAITVCGCSCGNDEETDQAPGEELNEL